MRDNGARMCVETEQLPQKAPETAVDEFSLARKSALNAAWINPT